MTKIAVSKAVHAAQRGRLGACPLPPRKLILFGSALALGAWLRHRIVRSADTTLVPPPPTPESSQWLGLAVAGEIAFAEGLAEGTSPDGGLILTAPANGPQVEALPSGGGLIFGATAKPGAMPPDDEEFDLHGREASVYDRERDTDITSTAHPIDISPPDATLKPLADSVDWHGKMLLNTDDEKLGLVEELYLNEHTNEPEWALVRTGLLGVERKFVPLNQAIEREGVVVIPVSAAQVEAAPSITAHEQRVSPAEEQELLSQYRLRAH